MQAVPGDRVRARVVKKKKLTPRPGCWSCSRPLPCGWMRRVPTAAFAGAASGSFWTMRQQLEFKQQHVREAWSISAWSRMCRCTPPLLRTGCLATATRWSFPVRIGAGFCRRSWGMKRWRRAWRWGCTCRGHFSRCWISRRACCSRRWAMPFYRMCGSTSKHRLCRCMGCGPMRGSGGSWCCGIRWPGISGWSIS
jgi:hypothetical protein